jgi:hypothetical protein
MHTRSAVLLSGVAMAVAAAVTWHALPAAAQPTPPQSAALRSFETVRAVFQHPRCQNCHIPGDAPLQYDDSRPHAQNVMRGVDGRGFVVMECSSCHGDENKPVSYGDRAPPGAPNWHLPPPETKMVFIGLGPRALCETIKNRRETAGKDLAGMLAHVRDDKLVGWGWNPGGVRTVPPASRQETVAAFKTWMDAGAPCPAQ